MDVNNPQKKRGLFAQCSFAIVRNASLKQDEADSLASELRLHDAQVVVDNYPATKLDIRGLTHVISTSSDFPDYEQCCDAMIPVVKPTWVQHSLARDKLSNPRQYNPDPRLFMSDVVACASSLPEGDADAIAGGVVAMGGLFSAKLTSQTTHIIAIDIEAETCVMAKKKKVAAKIVLPHWVDDCLKLGRKIDEQPYTLPDPEILRPPIDKPPIARRKAAQISGATNPDPDHKPSYNGPTRKLEKVFKKKSVMLSTDLGISSYLRGILDGIVTVSGGKLTESVADADMFICKFREGDDYKIASRSGKDVGNLAWLYYLITTDEWTSPLRRLLHYPVARHGLPGFPGLKISLSNYSGEARTYLENLIIAAGAECTKTLKQDNTHLVTAHVVSEKCAAANEWGIHIVNHLWIEESYAKWKMQSVTQSRYTHFPHRTNLGEIVGSTQLDRKVIEEHFFPREDTDMVDTTDSGATKQENHNGNIVNGGKKSKSSNEQIRTPGVSRFIATGKENITPSTTNSRKSKEVASARLHEMTPDILLFEKEKKRVGGVVYGGRRPKDEDRVQHGRKRSIDEASEDEATDVTETKKTKRGNPPPEMRLLVSGYKKWVNRAKVEDSDKKQLRSLGILTVQDPSKATHLAAPSIVRTQKFVTAIAFAPVVVSTDFIDACLKEDALLDPKKFPLKDRQAEASIGGSLEKAIGRASKNKQRLLQGQNIYVMESIRGGFETFKAIVEANGGRCMLWRNRKNMTVPSTRAESEESTDGGASSDLILVTDAANNNVLWDRFKQMAEKSRRTPRIVTADWLLETAISQTLRPLQDYAV
ncbi:hypothetical protein B0A52_03841 [Exophiala mesophila]|uniref:BRCT domain-containing protein n=1 Tax=Exophiala mesophila TaxID=212818 RepID=A0A438N7A9_EXOME|nr:hypothetical protein B0A52_03841 [Exophiala mesophila]